MTWTFTCLASVSPPCLYICQHCSNYTAPDHINSGFSFHCAISDQVQNILLYIHLEIFHFQYKNILSRCFPEKFCNNLFEKINSKVNMFSVVVINETEVLSSFFLSNCYHMNSNTAAPILNMFLSNFKVDFKCYCITVDIDIIWYILHWTVIVHKGG